MANHTTAREVAFEAVAEEAIRRYGRRWAFADGTRVRVRLRVRGIGLRRGRIGVYQAAGDRVGVNPAPLQPAPRSTETTAVRGARKLIEVALPLDPITAAAAREKSIRHGHPSTLHLWWARRPLAAARAVILDEVLAEQEGDFDADSRWAVAWFEQHGFDEGDYGDAETFPRPRTPPWQAWRRQVS